MATNNNRLHFILSADNGALMKSLRTSVAATRSAAEDIRSAWAGAGQGVEDLEQAAEIADFSAVAEEAQRSAEAAKKSFDRAADGIEQAFRDAELGDEVPASLDRARAAAERFATSAKSDMAGVERAVSDLADEVSELGTDLSTLSMAALADGARAASDSLDALTAGFRETGEEVRLTEQALRKIFTDPQQVATYSAAIVALKAQFEGLASDDLVEAIELLNRFGLTGEKQLQRVTNVAQATRKGISDIAEPYGEFMATAAKGGDFGALEQLRVLLGVGGEELKRFGAEIDANGKVLGDTSAQWDKAKTALDRYLDSTARYQDVSARSQDAVARLNTEMDKFSTSVGTGTNAVKAYIAEGLLPLAQRLNAADENTKTFLGTVAEGAGVLGSGAAKVAEIGAYSAVAANSLRGLTAAMTAAQLATATAVATTGAWVIGIGAAVAGTALLIKSAADMARAWRAAEKAQKSLLETQRRALEEDADRGRLAKASIKAIIDEVNAIEDAGKRRAAITNAIIGKEAEAAIARDKGNKSLAAALDAEAKALKRSRAEYDGRTSAAVKAEGDKTKAAQDGAKASAAAYQADADAHAAQQQRKADDAAKSADAQAAARERLQRLAEADADLQRSAIDLNRQALDGTSAEVAALESKLEKGQDVTAELTREIEARAANQKALLDAEAALDRIAIKQKAAADAAADPANADRIREQAAERERQLDQKVGMERQRIDQSVAQQQQAAADKLAAAAKKRADEQAAARQKELDLSAQAADLDLRAAEQARQQQEQSFQERREQLQAQAAMGVEVSSQLAKLDEEQAEARKDAIAKESALQIEALKRKAAAEKAGKSKAEQELIDRRTTLDIEREIQDARAETEKIVSASLDLLRAETAELAKQRDLLEAQNKEREKGKKTGFDATIQGGAQSVEDAFGTNASGWGVSRRDREAASAGDGPTLEELDRELARRRAQIANEEAGRRRRESPSTPAPQWGDGAAPPGRAPAPDAPPPMAASVDLAPLVAATNQQTQLLSQLVAAQTRAANSQIQTIGKHVSNPYLS